MAVSQDRDDFYFEAAQELIPQVVAAADCMDRERKLLPELANELVDKGFFRLLVPRSLGGAEMDHLTYLRIIQMFGEADGSTAWCLNQGNVFASRSAVMPETLAQEIWGDPIGCCKWSSGLGRGGFRRWRVSAYGALGF